MKLLKLRIADLNFDSVNNLLSWLGEQYKMEFVLDDPDFILHSCFGYQALKFDGVRIAWLGENIQPDFNISDYGMGFGKITFQDRYRRIPLYRWYFSDYESLFDEERNLIKVDGRREIVNKKRFCTMVNSNNNRGPYFDKFFDAISCYKTVDSGGRWNNNIGGPVSNKIDFLKQGKFHLAFENSSTPGYVTEKILHAFAARSVPIYWGAPDVVEDFNPRAFINCHDYQSIDHVIAEIRRLDDDDNAYASMLEEPIFIGGKEPSWLSKEEIMSWLTHIFDQPRDKAYRRNRFYWGERYQAEHNTAFLRPHIQFVKLSYRKIRQALSREEI
jgi:hypothetical protein